MESFHFSEFQELWRSVESHALVTSHIAWVPARVLAATLSIQLPANSLRKVMADSTSVWVPATHVGDTEDAPAFDLTLHWPLHLSGGVNQWTEELSASPFTLCNSVFKRKFKKSLKRKKTVDENILPFNNHLLLNLY